MGAGTSLDVAGVARAFISGIFGIETFGIEKDGIFGSIFRRRCCKRTPKKGI